MLQIRVLQQYMSQWYVGKIIEFDDEDREYHISFMDGSRKSSRWPEKDHGGRYYVFTFKHRKTRNMFKFLAKDLEKFQDMFDEI